ncbi:hypothetical protein DRJ22_00770 [Candidatus Woesearchaeota archaeon]|nr:MAG: hypothetical protein B6U93_02155 [Candidatus Woesearchaeota archaeon ex4484_78]RLE46890.1 MAG: hypothetical protein DRJ22_00770 [Candidatus Woesearchaeota archaeon]
MTDLIVLLYELKKYIQKRVSAEQIKDLSEIIITSAREEGSLRIARGAKLIQTKIKNKNFDWELLEREINNMISVIENRIRL